MDFNPFTTVKENVELSRMAADEVKTTTCYMCACRCGIRVHLKDGKVRYIEGNPEHPVNQGVLCAKGSAGIMNHYSPARLSKPLKRVGERGSGEFEEIEWDEALALATKWMGDARAKDPKKLAFFTGRDQSQSLTGWWASKFGTPNFAAHGGFCSVNMAAAGLYTIGGAFWEFGEPDWDHTKYFMLFGVAEDHDSNPIKIGLGKLKTRADAKFVSVNPVRTGYSSIADEWVGIRPGTDGLFIFALIHELLRAEKIDFDYLARYTNSHWLVYDNPGKENDGLFVRDKKGNPLCFDLKTKKLMDATNAANAKKVKPAFVGERSTGRGKPKARPVFELIARRYMADEYSPDAVAEAVGLKAADIKRIAAEIAHAAFEEEIEIDVAWTDWTGKKHKTMKGRPVSMHAMRGISAHSNGFHTCRALHLLQVLIGSVDVPGGFRYKSPFPKPIPPGPKPAGKYSQPNTPLDGAPIGNPTCPEDLMVDEDGKAIRIDKGYSWEFPMSSHGLMHMVLHNAWAKDPYGIDVLFMYMANMGWNSSMNTSQTIKYLTDKDENGEYKIPKFIYSDAYYSETVAFADLVLPDTTYLERWDCISLLDRPISSAHGPADAIRQPVVQPDRDVRAFQTVLLDLGARLGLEGMVNDDGSAKYPEGYPDYIVNHERAPGLGPLAGWREGGTKHGRGKPDAYQLDAYIENGCFWQYELPPSQQYYKHANKDYLEYAHYMGWVPDTKPIIFQLYSEPVQKFRLAAQGHGKIQPPEKHRARVEEFFDPLPVWYQPIEESMVDGKKYPLHALTQRPMHMYHSWGSQNAWLRQITSFNSLYIHPDTAAKYGVADQDWVWISSHQGRVKGQIKVSTGTQRDTVWTWNAIGKRKGAWGLKDDAAESNKGFLLNHIICELLPEKGGGYRYSNSDPVTGQAAWFDLRVNIEKCTAKEAGATEPMFEPAKRQPNAFETPEVLQYGKELTGKPMGGQAPLETWVANRHENALNIRGIEDGRQTNPHGNRDRRASKFK
ncbi:Anaerobic dimethyl sulfoxide reductase chain A, molybdopterin-binding domain [hydrothermal vent metagenome]|uniref:Anaerobic dimethyl sulfoxide reductase chain A, molybdopterin-binding domain n=1 Tax=hydrothermal vent metagenome TaxID=652676 RepID=A0A3B0SBL4_9ZZZZ